MHVGLGWGGRADEERCEVMVEAYIKAGMAPAE